VRALERQAEEIYGVGRRTCQLNDASRSYVKRKKEEYAKDSPSEEREKSNRKVIMVNKGALRGEVSVKNPVR